MSIRIPSEPWPTPAKVRGVCRFCDEVPDGDRASFIDDLATRCNKVACVLAWEQWREMAIRAERRNSEALKRLKAGRRRAA
ncbi:hypothetical protein GOB94_13905 [Granulicella sp. 5B5]|uniref:hypothetical protein n=1 Tax=Granulicella sp. 5B5 TaxID=1617967 RepID=UPI0015F61109|nr:hypothetical protein [Granulicella sp. 5B5]QMV19662.1 hypothetical protein GOB94_13905 [Granulicella sp. 5B5]